MLVTESMKSRKSRGEVPEQWSLAAVVTANVDRAEFFLVLARNCYNPVRSRYFRLTLWVVTGTEPNRVYIAEAHGVSLTAEVNAVHELHAADLKRPAIWSVQICHA